MTNLTFGTVLVCLRVQALYNDAKWIMRTVWILFGLFHTVRSALSIFGAVYIIRESDSVRVLESY